MASLDDKVAVITGGNSGIGLASAKRLVEEGAHVFIFGRRQAQLDAAVAEIGKNVTAVRGDATSEADFDGLYERVRADKGVIDIVVTSAGLVEPVGLAEATKEHFDKTFDLNIRGTYLAVQKALPLMTRGGAIVLVSSGMNQLGIPGHSAYAASKAAVRSFSRTWSAELLGRGIRVNTLSPGPVETPMIEAQVAGNPGVRDFYASMSPMKRLGTAEEMGAAVYFLASSQSSFCAGIDLIADGGITALG
ncbi:SDR family oxidoreductase [Mesorhizobium sp. VK23B]|uniref:SDR family oxidoreductase n=1 Tax=Mesorhizobium dulcispinae TaxID=3072316 RepID=A0ABU4XPH8_9HYPH|nr:MULTISPECIES: SDR family oxidoreductase [unclassified Mesorhizobium]MDX8470289.1 SDR family oxidoreductase [Mesorhizobium sp. VK23B]MDX8476656.1 SDR family oxidoreductase [Mesorhizobium sp. VK23A]